MYIIFPCSVGLLGAYLYQKCTGNYKPIHRLGYVKAVIILILLQIVLLFSSGKADSITCKHCKPMWIDQSDEMLKKYTIHFQRAEELYENIRLVNEHHKYDTEDAFVSGACGAILSTQITEARAKMIAIALTITADFFKEKYYCHRALRRYAENYRYEVYMMRKYKDQILKNIIMCRNCEIQYDYENYYGLEYYKYLEYWKAWYDNIDSQSNFGPGCYHTYKKTYKMAGDE